MTLITLPGVRKGRHGFHVPRPPKQAFVLSLARPAPRTAFNPIFNPIRVSGATQAQACRRLAEHAAGQQQLAHDFVLVLWRLVETGDAGDVKAVDVEAEDAAQGRSGQGAAA